MTDPLSDPRSPFSEADIRAALTLAESENNAMRLASRLARECLRLREENAAQRGLLAEAVGAMGPPVERHRHLSGRHEDGNMVDITVSVQQIRRAAAVAARVRGHLGGGQG